MSYGRPDLYYQPEQFGLTTLGEIEWSEPCYDFDLTAVWIDADFAALEQALTDRANPHAAPQIVDLLARVRQAIA